ncbi:MAG: hypothetical protein ACKOCB_12230 [Planctomycetia bacterium]
MPRLACRLQLLGLLVVAVAGWLPLHERVAWPGQPALASRSERQESAGEVLALALCEGLAQGRTAQRLWEARRWYPFALVLPWSLALLAVAWRPGWRTAVGTALMVLALGLCVLEACYLAVEYEPLLPRLLGGLEGVIAWLVVVALLFARRRGDRSLGAVEAHVASQALLGWLHLLTLPATQARGWLGEHGLGEVAGAVAANFQPAFWCALLGLLAMWLPACTRRLPADRPATAP